MSKIETKIREDQIDDLCHKENPFFYSVPYSKKQKMRKEMSDKMNNKKGYDFDMAIIDVPVGSLIIPPDKVGLGITSVEIQFDRKITIDQEKEVVEILKKRQFVERMDNGWRNGFVNVFVTKKSIIIGHDIKNNMLTVVSNPLLTLEDYINYFEKI